MGRILHGDIETGSRCDLKQSGLYRYAEDESTFLRCFGYAFDREPVKVWVPYELPYAITDLWEKRRPNNQLIVHPYAPADLREHIIMAGEFRAHNAAFERRNLVGTIGRTLNFPIVSASQMVCTMAKAAAHGLPHGLEDLAQALGTKPKKATGVNDMRYLAKPRTGKGVLAGTFAMPDEEPERFVSLFEYNIDDVEAERDADFVIPDLSPYETRVYALDQLMNDRGWACDIESVENLIALVEQRKEELLATCLKITGVRPSQTGQLADWCRDHGYIQLPNLQKDTVKRAQSDPECPDNVRHVLRIFSTYNMKAVTKLPAMLRAVCKDGRLHGMFRYHAADTGRWSSVIVQLQNLFRPIIDNPEEAVETARSRELDDLKLFHPVDLDGVPVDSMKIIGSCVRSVLTAAQGRVLVFPDFAGIENRANAWLWNESWKTKAYRDYDTFLMEPNGELLRDEKGKPIRVGPDLYIVAYAKAFNISFHLVDKAGRQIGKVMELALGYEGGVGAFVTMAENYGIDLDKMAEAAWPTLPEDIKQEAAGMWEWAVKQRRTHDLKMRTFIVLEAFKRLWRRAHPRIVSGWKVLSDTARAAIREPGKAFTCARGKIQMRVWRQWLCVRLPSGRVLWYFRPSVDSDDTIRFWGTDTYTRRWCKTSTYGGKLNENIIQAISRDLLVFAKFNLEERGYEIIGSVHDEPVAETDEDFGSLEEVFEIMRMRASWFDGLPLAFEGHRQWRYRK